MDFKAAFEFGILKAEERAGQPTPAQVLAKFVADISEAANGALTLHLVGCPYPPAAWVPTPLTDGYMVLADQPRDGSTRLVPVCAVDRKAYPLTARWGIALNWHRGCRDSTELAQCLDRALREDAVADLLHSFVAESQGVGAFDVGEAVSQFARAAAASAAAVQKIAARSPLGD